ncbi:polysaccharide biosynthesis/export family protein [Wenyingzhuangia sp. 2_MG-2023]|uniref:polysaccharide biosynthesis/export family protein n=1 Tax=Wenyingzhuangia sp. 2_MG-2023 TaxID=3062639 RepID=UPI0026E2B82E|nr:polysaccharide biosynthesis/export family protein [Wenyingzhuangia sp. 2_MG-2023]MDO6739085.1 polysaccharide biosynthesis/export family protein [Wenyingzhuangia sp. 2_MG-2023]
MKIFKRKQLEVGILLVMLSLQSCVYKKDILYFQDASELNQQKVERPQLYIQPNDILSIAISALVSETAVVYNKKWASEGSSAQPVNNLEILKLQGYLVANDGSIQLPVLGTVQTENKTINDLRQEITKMLEEGKHLVQPSVDIRLLNAKVTVLGEVKRPGTYNFTEQTLSIPQALGYAGDLTVKGKRKDIVLIREVQGKRKVFPIDLTQTDWINQETYYIQPNDVLIINPNQAQVKSAGYLGNVSSLIGVISLVITTTVLLTN